MTRCPALWTLTMAVVVLSLSAVRAEESPPAPVDAGGEVTIKVNAKDLYTEYRASEKKANAKYKDRVIEVTGVVRHLDRNDSDRAFVELGTGYGDDNVVKCFFGRDKSKLKSLKGEGGQTVTIRGTCRGLKGPHINLSECDVVRAQ